MPVHFIVSTFNQYSIRMRTFLLLLLLGGTLTSFGQGIKWQKVDDGLHYAEIPAPIKSTAGDQIINILKIDPAQYTFELASAKNDDKKKRTAAQWCERKDWIAAINAGMFRTDGLTNVALQGHYKEINNNVKKKDYGAIACFNAKEDGLPNFDLVDLNCQEWDVIKTQYNSFLQGMRMIDCHQKPLGWNKQADMKSSMVTLAQDLDGNVLFIFCRSPYSANDMISMVLELPLKVRNMMYLEGGPESSLVVKHNGFKVEKNGSFETRFNENDDINQAWPLPNLLGIRKRE